MNQHTLTEIKQEDEKLKKRSVGYYTIDDDVSSSDSEDEDENDDLEHAIQLSLGKLPEGSVDCYKVEDDVSSSDSEEEDYNEEDELEQAIKMSRLPNVGEGKSEIQPSFVIPFPRRSDDHITGHKRPRDGDDDFDDDRPSKRRKV